MAKKSEQKISRIFLLNLLSSTQMFEKYKATIKDFEAIEGGLKKLWQKEMDFVFEDRDLIKNAVLISYDSRFLYLWTKFRLPELTTIQCRIKEYHAYRISHEVKLKDEWQLGWMTSLAIRRVEKLLPKGLQESSFKIPKISGGFLTPFIELQKKAKDTKLNPYITYESYLATILHEFGHIYYNQHKLWWYSNKQENLKYLKNALNLYLGIKAPKKRLHIPSPLYYSEIFAFCTEYWASNLFWPKHKQNLDVFAEERLKRLIKEERKKNLEQEDSALEPSKIPHDFALVFGKIILHQYPHSWPQILTSRQVL